MAPTSTEELVAEPTEVIQCTLTCWFGSGDEGKVCGSRHTESCPCICTIVQGGCFHHPISKRLSNVYCSGHQSADDRTAAVPSELLVPHGVYPQIESSGVPQEGVDEERLWLFPFTARGHFAGGWPCVVLLSRPNPSVKHPVTRFRGCDRCGPRRTSGVGQVYHGGSPPPTTYRSAVTGHPMPSL